MDQSKPSPTPGGTPQTPGSPGAPLSSSPRSAATRGGPRGGAKLPKGPRPAGNPGNQENQENQSPGAPRRTAGRGRTTSESERGGKGSRGPAHRRRGLSETEGRAGGRDKYDSLTGRSHALF